MDDDRRLERMEKTIEKIHQTVVSIENVHGAKLEALADGQGVASERLDRLEAGQERLEAGQERLEAGQETIKAEVRDTKRTVGLLHSIANDHESRLQEVESSLHDHLSSHP